MDADLGGVGPYPTFEKKPDPNPTIKKRYPDLTGSASLV